MIDTQGQLLVAPPNMPDWRFQKTVVYMWRHDVSGAAGVIINKKCTHPTFEHICNEGTIQRLPNIKPPVYYGGPILNNIIGVLHSKDYLLGSTNTGKTQQLAFTLDRKILESIAQGGGPKNKLITLGMANWETGQLEAELDATPPRTKTMSWLLLPYDENIVFGPQREDLWDRCVAKAIKNKTQEITAKYFKD
jgi:putative transcriptional regulator